MGDPVLWLGTYESDYPRTRVLVRGLEELGIRVEERHRAVWERQRHKVGMGPRRLVGLGARFVGAWTSLARDVTRRPAACAVVVGYPAQPDAPFAWLAARRLGAPLVVDLMISLWDTLAGDRGQAGAVAARVLRAADRAAVRAADILMVDTQASADFVVAHLGARAERVIVVPVGADPSLFPAAPPPSGPPTALFYGKLSPMHGLDTLVLAAAAPGVPPVRIVGDGQMGPWLDERLAAPSAPSVSRERWVPYERLGGEIARAGICLGVFGTSEKAARVIPNKVWQAMAVGRPIVTADGPASRELLTDGQDALLVPPGDSGALADALRRLGCDAGLRARMGEAARRRFEEVGAPRAVAERLMGALAVRCPSTFRS